MVYDCFIFFNELDILEIRLNELNDVVDKFVLVEADRTFQNNPKPFIFEENKHRFNKFLNKIIHIKLTSYPLFIPVINPFSPWKLEFYQRDSVVKGLKNCKPDDIIMISDVDEIPRASVVKEYVAKGIDRIYGLKMDMFMFFFNNKMIYDAGSSMNKKESENGIWHCTALLPYKLLKKRPYRLRKTIMRTKRKGEVYKIIPNAGWHFTYMGGVEMIKKKLESFSHTEYNLEEFKNEASISQKIKEGKDLFGRDMEFEIVNPSAALPEYLNEHSVKQQFADYILAVDK